MANKNTTGSIISGSVTNLLGALTGLTGSKLGTSGNDTIYGDSGNNDITGLSGDDLLYGNGGNDKLFGNSGNDTLYGGDGNDRLFGGESEKDTDGEDEDDSRSDAEDAGGSSSAGSVEALYGDAGNDTIHGGSGSDYLNGGADDDKLYGGSGDDRLQGEGGADQLFGGLGKDRYVYLDAGDSSAKLGKWNAATGDTIIGFHHGSDKLDFSGLKITGNGNLQWSAKASAYGVWSETSKGSGYIYADTDGNGVADLAIKVKGNFELTASDIIFPATVAGPRAVDDTGTAVEAGIAAGVNAAGNVLTGAGGDISPNGSTLSVTAIQAGAEGAAGSAGSVGAGIAGLYGTLTVNANGAYTYAVNNSNPDVNALKEGEALTESFTYTVSNAQGVTDKATLTITIQGANDAPVVDSHSGAETVALQVSENVSMVTTVHAVDVDHGTVLNYAISGGADKEAFMINATTGVLSFKTAANAEAPSDADGNNFYEVTVTVSDGKGGADSQSFVINVNDVNEFAVTAVTDVNSAANAVNENAVAGTVVGITAFASDADATTNGVTYSLLDNAGGRFAIDAATGVVTTTGAGIDRESASGFNIMVRATSADGSTSDAAYAIAVNDVNEFAISAVTDVNSAANAVNENAVAGTVVGITAFASDADATNNGISYSLTDDAGGRFTIDAATGVVTTTGAGIDRESASGFNIMVRATSADGSTSDAAFAIAVNDANEFAVSAVTDVNSAANAVNENAVAGTVVGITAFASDADATNNGISYSLTDNAGGRFAIDAVTGVVTTTGAAVDYELNHTFTIGVRGTSADGSVADAAFVIDVQDVSEFSVTDPADVDAAVNAVNENAVAGTVVGITALAADADATNNAVSYSLVNDAGGRLAIDSATGVVTTTGTVINRETTANLNITVRATSADGSTADTNFSIEVNDVNEFAVTMPLDSDAKANSVEENAAAGTLVSITAFAEDADATNNGITYSLMDDAGGRFTINSQTGVVSTTGVAIDYEETQSLTIAVRATSQDGSTADASFVINVDDHNEFAVTVPVDSDGAANIVEENAVAGTVVGITAFANDADVTNNTVVYSLVNDADGRFAIDGNTGVVTTTGADIDRESYSSLDIRVRATSSDGSTAEKNFNIDIADVNEFAASPVTDVNTTSNSVDENAAAGTVVNISARSVDADATNNKITYSLLDDAGGRFAINVNTGHVTTTGAAIDYETTTQFSIVVRATSADGSTADGAFDIAVNNVNEFDVTKPVDTDGAENTVQENAAAGTLVGLTAFASDADSDSGAITYSLLDDGNGRFAIDGATGVVSTTGSLINYELRDHYDLVVRAVSGDGSFASATFRVNVTDVNDTAPDFTSAASRRVDENIAASEVVYDAQVTDPDGAATVFSLTGEDAALFAIDAASGEVRFLASPNYEAPLDADMDNRYKITVHAFDGVQEATKDVTIVVDDVVEIIPNLIAPEFTSGDSSVVAENTQSSAVIYDAQVTDPDGDAAVFSLGGDDSAFFSIDSITGEVRFLSSPDYENALDADHNNIYQIIIHANDGVHDTAQAVAVTVTNIVEPLGADPNDFDNAGADVPLNTKGTSGDDTLAGTAGADTINAGTHDDIVYGRGGNDSLAGGNGLDVLYGQAGDDTLDGGDNSDTLYGGSGNDSILGGAGNNVIYGGSGQDTVTGIGGKDTIIGGYGADTIIDGNTSADHFVYLSINDTGDTIVNFAGLNIFNFSAIDANTAIAGNDAFAFVAAQNANVVANSVTWHQADGKTYIHADVNGDAISDLDITLSTLVNLTAGTFIL